MTTTAEGKITHKNPLLINLQHELISFDVELEIFSLLWVSGAKLQRISGYIKPTHLDFFCSSDFSFLFPLQEWVAVISARICINIQYVVDLAFLYLLNI